MSKKKKPAGKKGKTPKATPKKVVATKVAKSSPKVDTRPKNNDALAVLPFGPRNYLLLAIGVAIIGFGFFLMSTEDFVDAREFSVSLYIAPIVVVAGFLEIIYAIMYSPPKTASGEKVE